MNTQALFYEKASPCQARLGGFLCTDTSSFFRPGFYSHSGEPFFWLGASWGPCFGGRCNLPGGFGLPSREGLRSRPDAACLIRGGCRLS